MAGEMIRTESQLVERLQSTARRSLTQILKERNTKRYLVVDCSGSMSGPTDRGERKIDALRKVVADVREQVPCPVLAFGHAITPEVVDNVPEPCGGTPLHDAIEFAVREKAAHMIVVSDGAPDSRSLAKEQAKLFHDQGGKIDVVFVGSTVYESEGAQFLKELAEMTGGTSDALDLSQLQLVSRTIVGLLGAGQAQLPGGAIQL